MYLCNLDKVSGGRRIAATCASTRDAKAMALHIHIYRRERDRGVVNQTSKRAASRRGRASGVHARANETLRELSQTAYEYTWGGDEPIESRSQIATTVALCGLNACFNETCLMESPSPSSFCRSTHVNSPCRPWGKRQRGRSLRTRLILARAGMIQKNKLMHEPASSHHRGSATPPSKQLRRAHGIARRPPTNTTPTGEQMAFHRKILEFKWNRQM